MKKIYTYTLAFIKYQDKVLMLNRIKTPWQGLWNGLGGKIEKGETPKASMIRELKEEMGVTFFEHEVIDKGVLTWNQFDAKGQGIHLFVVELNKPLTHSFPIKTDEGILDMKPYKWIIDETNLGVAPNIPYFLPYLFEHHRHHFHCVFEQDRLKKVEVIPL